MNEKRFYILLLTVSAISLLIAVLNIFPEWKTFFIAFGFTMGAHSVVRIRYYSKNEKAQ
ncbi:hypothetical protein [Alkalicoccobacillus gibsonii]|uniref:hypothetical protein n=1 Tax=Alkalicoccobacillus gibsonii TaxID=79881 RepID=UPI0035146A05